MLVGATYAALDAMELVVIAVTALTMHKSATN